MATIAEFLKEHPEFQDTAEKAIALDMYEVGVAFQRLIEHREKALWLGMTFAEYEKMLSGFDMTISSDSEG